jgi:hypothetical protein
MTLKVTHIYKERDNCADKMANIDLYATTYMWCNDLSYLIKNDFILNRLGLPL